LNYVLVDSNYQVNRAIFKNNDLKNSKGDPTGGIYIFLRMLYKLLERGNLICVFDGGHSSFRTNLYPNYKKREEREETPENKELDDIFSFTFSRLKSLLPKMDIPVVQMSGEEADDIIYRLAEYLIGQGHAVTVVSDDNDYLQMVNIGATVLRPMKDEVYLKSSFEHLRGFPPEYFIYYKAMIGDGSDNIPGIKGIGDVTAKKIIDQMIVSGPTIESLHNVSEKSTSSWGVKIKSGMSIIKRNIMLMDLAKCPLTLEDVSYTYLEAEKHSATNISFVNGFFNEMEFTSLNHWLVHLSIKNKQEFCSVPNVL